jgi:hypothetical protein
MTEREMATCTGCGRAHDASSWRRLELVDRIARDRLAAVVTSWPAEIAVEVRRCNCGDLMARSRAAPPGAGGPTPSYFGSSG